MARIFVLAILAISLGGCGVTAVVGAAASVVGAAADVTGSVVSGTVDIVGSGVSGAIDLATGDDEDEKKISDRASPSAPAFTEPASSPSH